MYKSITYGELKVGDKVFVCDRLIEVTNIKSTLELNEHKGVEELCIRFNGKFVEGADENIIQYAKKGNNAYYRGEINGQLGAWSWVSCRIKIE